MNGGSDKGAVGVRGVMCMLSGGQSNELHVCFGRGDAAKALFGGSAKPLVHTCEE